MSYPSKKLEEVCKITMGQAPEGDSYNTDNEGLALIAGAGDFGEKFPKPKKYTTKPNKKSEKGEIILCIRATIGDINISDKEYCLGRGVAGLVADEKELNQFYLWHWLKFSASYLKSKGKGATFLQVTKQDITSLEIPLPPLNEQKRIAEILDKADDLRQKRQQSIEKLDELLQATFIDMFGDPVSNSKNHKKMKLIDVLLKLTDGTHHSPVNIEDGIPYITAKHIKEGFVDFFSKPTYISLEDHKAIYSRCDPVKGDILYIKDGATTGIAAINNFDFEFSLLSSVALLRPNIDLITSEYLESWLNHSVVKKNIISNMGGAAIKRLTLAKIKQLEILLPDITLQRKFTVIKNQIEKQKEFLLKQLIKQENLFKSLQQRAFNGEL